MDTLINMMWNFRNPSILMKIVCYSQNTFSAIINLRRNFRNLSNTNENGFRYSQNTFSEEIKRSNWSVIYYGWSNYLLLDTIIEENKIPNIHTLVQLVLQTLVIWRHNFD